MKLDDQNLNQNSVNVYPQGQDNPLHHHRQLTVTLEFLEKTVPVSWGLN